MWVAGRRFPSLLNGLDFVSKPISLWKSSVAKFALGGLGIAGLWGERIVYLGVWRVEVL